MVVGRCYGGAATHHDDDTQGTDDEWDPAAQFSATPLPTASLSAEATERWETTATGPLGHGLQQGTLDVDGLDSETVRLLMQPRPGHPTETERYMATLPSTLFGAPAAPLLDSITGQVIGLDRLEHLRADAAAKGDRVCASELARTIDVVGPKPPLTLAGAAPCGVDAKVAQFEEHGFVCLPNVLTGETLARAQAAWERCEAPAREAWLVARECNFGIDAPASGGGQTFGFTTDGSPPITRKTYGLDQPYGRTGTISSFLDMDMAFLDLIHCDQSDSPGSDEVWRVAARVLGLEDSDVRCTHIGPRTFPSDSDGAGYTYWHRDGKRRSPQLKMFLYLSDVSATGGPLAVVPGSHALPLGPLEMLRCPFRSSMTLDATLPQAAMPNHYKFAAKAGTALIFDLATWHTAMPCLPGQPDRRCAIIGWGGAGGAGASLSTERLVEVEAAKRLTPTLRRLLGLGAAASQ